MLQYFETESIDYLHQNEYFRMQPFLISSDQLNYQNHFVRVLYRGICSGVRKSGIRVELIGGEFSV